MIIPPQDYIDTVANLVRASRCTFLYDERRISDIESMDIDENKVVECKFKDGHTTFFVKM